MDIYSKKGKKKLIGEMSPSSPIFKNTALAFLFGGSICALGEALRRLFITLGAAEDMAVTYVALSIITVAAILTALGIFDSIARHAGAGTLVPISGFSNAVTSQAIDAKSEGFVLGVGAKIFSVSGPVILFGLAAGVIFGIVYYLIGLM